MAADEEVLMSHGEITGKPMYQVRGDPHWHSTPAIARRVHASIKKAEAEGFYTKGKKNDVGNKR
jgi:L-amino acid N-acyltransferase YncA